MKRRFLFLGSARFQKRALGSGVRFVLPVFLLICFVHRTGAISLERVLQTTLENNPSVQEAKAGLEQVAGQSLGFRSVAWPHVELGVPAGLQYGHRAGESGVKGFAVGRGALDQTLFNVAVPHSLRRGDVGILIAQQQLNVAVVEQLHAARLAFYAALYNRSLESIRKEQQQKLQENAVTQKNRFEAGLANRSAFTSATIPAVELETQIAAARRAYLDAQLQLAQAMGIDPARKILPGPDGELDFVPMHVALDAETAAALERRADVKLARIANYLRTTEERERSLASATAAAEESARVVQENVASGLVSPLEYRITQNGLLETKSGLLDATYQHNLARAEWDRARGRYFQFCYDTPPSR